MWIELISVDKITTFATRFHFIMSQSQKQSNYHIYQKCIEETTHDFQPARREFNGTQERNCYALRARLKPRVTFTSFYCIASVLGYEFDSTRKICAKKSKAQNLQIFETVEPLGVAGRHRLLLHGRELRHDLLEVGDGVVVLGGVPVLGTRDPGAQFKKNVLA